MSDTYEIELQASAWRVDQEGFAPGSGLYCLVVATTPDEAAQIAYDETGDEVTRVSGPYSVKSNGVYLNRPRVR